MHDQKEKCEECTLDTNIENDARGRLAKKIGSGHETPNNIKHIAKNRQQSSDIKQQRHSRQQTTGRRQKISESKRIP
jgi:hypothetical protein